jgi:SAM-dependent methyltransferase
MVRLVCRHFGFGLLVNGYAQFLPFPSCSFDQIISTFPSDFLWQPETLAEAWRVLVPGGELIILPVAWITGRRPAERLAAWLFRLTGQSPPSPDLETALTEPLSRAGFQVRSKLTRLNSSLGLLIFARKAGSLVK